MLVHCWPRRHHARGRLKHRFGDRVRPARLETPLDKSQIRRTSPSGPRPAKLSADVKLMKPKGQWVSIALLSSIAAAWPLAACAQHSVTQAACGWIGVGVSPMPKAFADSLGMTKIYGAIFKRPRPGSPAAAAGIEAGDVITTINGSSLRNWTDFTPTISMMAPGTTVYLVTWRSRQSLNVSVTLGYSDCPASPKKKARRLRAS